MWGTGSTHDGTVAIHYDIWYVCQLQLGLHPVAVVQYTFTHNQYI